MNSEEFDNEAMYQMTMSIMRIMLENKLINEEEYKKVSAAMQEKYKPVLGGLFSDIHLELH